MAAGANLLRVRSQLDDKAGPQIDGLRGEFDKLAGSKGAQTIMQGVGIGAGIGAWGLLDKAISGVVDIGVEAIKKGSDLRESQALTTQVFTDNRDAVEAWARSMDDAFSTSEALNFASQFGNAFKNVGFALDDVTERSKAMTTLAGDLGSAFNTSSEEAAVALRSGLLGESEPLRRFGVFLDEAKTKARASAMGMEILGGKLTDGQEVAARYALIMEQTADSQGMFSRDTGSLADASKRLQTNLDDLQASIGTKLVPILANAANGANQLVTELGRLDNLPTTAVEPMYQAQNAIEGIGDALDNTLDFLTPWDTYMSAAASRQEAMWNRLGGSMQDMKGEFLAARAAATATSDGVTSLSGTVGDLGDTAAGAADAFDDLRKATDKALDQFLDTTLGPKELKLQLQGARLELKDNLDKLAELQAVKNPTRAAKEDIIATKLAIEGSKREITETTGALEAMGKIAPGKTEKTVDKLFGSLAATTDEAWAAFDAIGAVLRLSGRAPSARGLHQAGDPTGLASGGLAPPGWVGKVGEDGPETLIQFPGGGGYVLPNAGGGGGATRSSGQPVEITLRVDGREMARVVDRHLSYEAARAPRSASA